MEQKDKDAPVRRSGGAHSAKHRRKKKKKGGKIVLIVLLVLLVAVVGVVVGLFFHMYGLMDTSALKAGAKATPAPVTVEDLIDIYHSDDGEEENEEPVVTPTPSPTPEPLTEEQLREIEENELRSSLQEEAEELIYSENVYNILLLGSDGRKSTLERSDAMLVLSVNKETKSIWVTSLMRDTQVTLDGWGLPHLNWCTTIGGIDCLIGVIEHPKNFALKIDNWMLVDFLDFAEIADMLGPITVTVTDRQAKNMNKLIREVCRLRDKTLGLKGTGNETPRCYFPEEGGTVTIDDGIQILGYCRERKITGDTGRSQKQRDALMQMWGNVKKMSLTEQYQLVEKVMSIVTTDLTPGQCASLLLQAPSMLNYEVYGQQCPVVGALSKGMDHNNLSTYFADWRVNRNFLRATIYGEEMTKQDLTSSWTGQLVWWPEEKQENAG